MTDASTTELEREAELRRAEMAETADRLRARMTPGQLIDELANTFRGGDIGAAMSNLGSQVRDNPIALLLIGAGMASLYTGAPGSRTNGYSASRRSWTGTGTAGVSDYGSDYGDPDSSFASSASDMAGSAYDGTTSALGNMRDRAASAGSAASDRVTAGMESVSGFARDAGMRTRDAMHSMEGQVADIVRREPLVLGAVGLAIGAALGALLPESRLEEEHLRDYERQMLKAGSEAARDAARKAGDVLAAAGEAALDEAERQRLLPEEGGSATGEKSGSGGAKSGDLGGDGTKQTSRGSSTSTLGS